ncbi:MAG: tetratricopeptide repeat protein [Bacteroidetes bacterium]|nr:tetratricopeptide repeat protein [Bacteroidota bacterium]
MLNYKQIYSACLILFIFISGCSTWENFTTYFNVYYNAKLNFDEAMEDISKNEKDIFEFKEKPVSVTADKALTKVIEKCSAILQYNAESAYFDDALFIIGVAYYYKQNYSKALRKFRELEAVQETDLSLQNKLWIGKTELQLRNFEEGINQLEEVKKLALEEENVEILESAYRTQIAFNFFQENFENAVEIINDFLRNSENDETKAEVAFQLGKIYLEINNLNKAAESFASVMSYSPSIKTEFQSKLELAKTNLMLDDLDKSLEILEQLKTEDKFKPFSDVIFYELGVTYLKQEKLEDAVENFLTVDSMKVLSQKETAGLARLKLGELWEYEYMDYDSAAKYYNKAASSILTADEKSNAISKTTLFRNYKSLTSKIYKNDRQLAYLNYPEEFIKDSIDYEDYLFDLKQDSLENSSSTPTENVSNTDGSRERARDTKIVNPLLPEEKRFKPIKPTISADSLQTLVSKDKFEMGNMFFIELDVPDSAFYYYTDVLENYPERTFTPNVMFALGSYYLTTNDTLKADSIFQYIYDEYQGLKVAEQAANRLGILEFDVETDSSAQYFFDAEKKYLNKNYSEAINSYYFLADKFPESILAPKALYSAGWILENELKNLDSAAVVFDTLNARYDKSLYAKDIFPKLQEYKREMQQRETKALSDDSTKTNDIEKNNKNVSKVKDTKIVKDDSIEEKISINPAAKDSVNTPESLRKQRFLNTAKEELKSDSSDGQLKLNFNEESENINEMPDSTMLPDSLKPNTKQLLKK